MDKKIDVDKQISKEFQMKLVPRVGWKDADYLAAAQEALTKAIFARYGNDAVFYGGSLTWTRRGTRFDVAGMGFKARNLTLAIEASAMLEGTKVKCKYHNFIPELLCKTMEDSVCWPTRDTLDGKCIDPEIKLEEDIHFDNIKFCLSGSVKLPGVDHTFEKVKDFGNYFAHIEDWIPKETPLGVVSDWDEVIRNDMEIREGSLLMGLTFYLCNRWLRSDGSLDESELSFKVKMERETKDGKTKKEWDYERLREANALYLELQKDPVFVPAPSIFFVDTPASSTSIKALCKDAWEEICEELCKKAGK